QLRVDDRVDAEILGGVQGDQVEDQLADFPADGLGQGADRDWLLDGHLAGAWLGSGALGAGVDLAAADAFVLVVDLDVAAGDGHRHAGLALLGPLFSLGVAFTSAGKAAGLAAAATGAATTTLLFVIVHVNFSPTRDGRGNRAGDDLRDFMLVLRRTDRPHLLVGELRLGSDDVLFWLGLGLL